MPSFYGTSHLDTVYLTFRSAVQQMINHSEDIVNVKERNGFTALHFSALNNDTETTRILLQSVRFFFFLFFRLITYTNSVFNFLILFAHYHYDNVCLHKYAGLIGPCSQRIAFILFLFVNIRNILVFFIELNS